MFINIGQRQILAYESKYTNIEDTTENHKTKDLEMSKMMKNGGSRESNSVMERIRIILVEEPNILKHNAPEGIVSE